MTLIYLFLAIILEVAGTSAMKLSDGFEKPVPSVLLFVFYILSFIFLTLSLKRLEVGLAYAIWAGVGTLLIALVGVFYFNEPMTIIKASSLFLIIVGVIGLKAG